MSRSVSPMRLPLSEVTGEQRKAVEPAAPLPTQNPDDLCLAERVERSLRATGYGPLREVQVRVDARTVLLAGRVPSYYLKQVAQATAMAVPGAHRVRVVWR